MKNRSELREVIIKVLYQIGIYEDTKINYNLNDIIHEQLDVKNSFVNDTIDGIQNRKKEIYDIANKYLKDWTNVFSSAQKYSLYFDRPTYILLCNNYPFAVSYCMDKETVVLSFLFYDEKIKDNEDLKKKLKEVLLEKYKKKGYNKIQIH